MSESPIFFSNGSRDLFGVLHGPATSEPMNGLVLCHPFGEEKLWSHRVFVNFAREAAKYDIAVLRFDFTGHGDSEGESENANVDTYLSDIDAAIKAFSSYFPSVTRTGLLGLRLGATLAFLYARQNKGLDPLILWEPIIDSKRYMQELLRINLSTQLAVFGEVKQNREALVEQMDQGIPANVDGYLISKLFYEQCNNINLLDANLTKFENKSLIVQIAPNIKQKDRAELIEFVNCQPNREFVKVEEPPFWREIKPFCSSPKNLIGNTIQWLEKELER